MTPAELHAQSYEVTPRVSSVADRLGSFLPSTVTPFPAQLAAVERLMQTQHELCAHHPGAGKTPIALMAAHLVDGPVIVTCPPGILGQWEARAKAWGHFDVARITGYSEAAAFRITAKLTLVADSVVAKLRIVPSALVVLDECHRFKTPDAARTRAVLTKAGLAGRAGKILALSGTPAVNGPVELYPLLSRIAPDLAPTWKAFTDRYCPPYEERFGAQVIKKYDRAANVPELNRRLRETVLHRPKREHIEAQLPPVRRDSYVLPVCISTIPEEMALEAFSGDVAGAVEAPAFAECRRRVGEAKAAAAEKMLQTYCEGGDRPLIFCWHRSVAEALGTALKVPAIHGGHSMVERRAAAAAFITGQVPALVATIGSLGTGVDGLQHATDFVVFVERNYVPSDNEQAEGRIWRTGQTKPCRFLILHAADPMDRALDATLRAKSRVLEGISQ